MSNWVNGVKELVSNGKTDKALKTLFDVGSQLNNELDDEITLLRSRWSGLNIKDKQGLAKDVQEEVTKINKAILGMLRQINNEFPDFNPEANTEPVVSLNESVEKENSGIESLKDIEQGVAILKQNKLGHNSSEDDIKKAQDLKKKLYNELFGELDESIDNIEQVRSFQSGIYFDEIFTSPKLDKLTLQEITNIRTDNNKYKWYDRSLIVSALTLSLISHKFDSKKLGLLIDFLTDFEDEVWQRALVGVVLTLQYHQNRIKRFNSLVKRLKTLQSLPRVQKGLGIIDYILLYNLYEQTLFNPKVYGDAFFLENPRNCFLPFYENNPNLEEAMEQTENKDLELDEVARYIKKLPLLNAHKYFLSESLKKNQLIKVQLEEKEARIFNNTLDLSHYLHPYQNLITEFYLFYSFYPKNNIKNLFSKEMNLANAKLKDIILGESDNLFISARAAYKNKKYGQAIGYCDKILKINRDDFFALEILANSYFEKKIYHNAILNYKKLINIGEGNQGRYNEQIGLSYYNKKEYKNSLRYFKKAIEIEPSNSQYITALGASLFELEKYKKALVHVEEAVKNEPNNARYLNNLGAILKCLKRTDEALIHVRKAVNIESDNIDYLSNLTNILVDLKRYDKALMNAEKALSIKPKNIDCKIDVIKVLAYLKRYDEALIYAEEAVKNEPNNPHSLLSLGTVLQYMKRYKDAIGYAEKANRITPKAVGALNLLGRLNIFLNELDKAEKILLSAIKIKNEDVLYGNLGHLELYKGNNKKAMFYYKKCIELLESSENFNDMFEKDIPYLTDLGVDLNLCNQIKEQVIKNYKK